jgi:hypothetical protein
MSTWMILRIGMRRPYQEGNRKRTLAHRESADAPRSECEATVSAVQSDLFDNPHLEGLAQANGIIAPSEDRALTASIDAVELSPFHSGNA